MQSVVESEQEKIDVQKNMDERQLNKSRYGCSSIQKVKNIYIFIIYIFKKKRERKIELEVSPTGRTHIKTTSSKVLPVGL